MASWQAKGRDPLFDQTTQAALERRGKEILGAGLMLLGLLIALMLWSWSPDDPNFLSATDAAAQNWLGAPGAYLSAPLMMIAGYGSWALVLGAVGWGLRFILHRGEERFMRALFLPIAVVLWSVYATSVVPHPDWGQTFGLGGHFGDMVMAAILNLLPVAPHVGIKIAALLMAVVAVAFTAFVLGYDKAELRLLWSRFTAGLGVAAQGARHVAARGAEGARTLAAAQAARRAAKAETPAPEMAAPDAPAPRVRMAAPPEAPLPEPEIIDEVSDYEGEAPSPDEVNHRITDAIRDRMTRAPILSAVTARLVPEAKPAPVAPPAPVAAAPAPVMAPHYEVPPLELLSAPAPAGQNAVSQEVLIENARMLEAVLDDYGVKGQITEVRPGPVVTLYELEPAPGLKASRVIGLADDIARSMSALSARVSTVPGRTVIGIELPNARREKVVLREILSARAFGDGTHPLPLALGKDIGGEPVVANLAKMPHLLIAGTTGSGKSVAINTMILSLLYKLTPEECRLIMIDPKMLELSVYDGIPHLLSPVVTDPKKAVVALKWVVGEMEERYRRMSKMGVRNIEGYNGRVREALAKDELFRRTVQTGFDEDTGEPVFETEEFQPETFPYIVVIVDEMADLMMVAGKEIEACIQRLAQMARASGIHLIMATQRPSVDVITGTIKANFPTRISFQVTSKIDSRTILGEQGAEQLLGQGDMLYMGNGARITRIHGPFVSDEEVEEVVTHLKSFGPPSYKSGVVDGPEDEVASDIDAVLGLGGEGSDDQLYDQAVMIVAKDRKCSTSYIQRKLAIGYNKAARLVEQMEEQGVVSAANHVGKREVLVPEV